jgi:putative DNA primase/helicase
MPGIFDQARAAVTRSVVEHFASAPGAYWQGGEFFTLNPIRGDSHIGSFSISEEGLWHDFADDSSGDLVDLVVATGAKDKRAAAEAIIRAAGRVVEDDGWKDQQKADRSTKTKKKSDKPAAQIPAPEDALKSLNAAISERWVGERHGKPVKGWTYRTAAGGVAFCVARFEKPDGSKDVLPWYYGTDAKWHPGQALETGRPLYKLDQLVKADKGVPVLVVEGEKCASIDVPGFLVVCWSGGSSATAKTDWAPLEGREVVVWPDADEAGTKAAQAIARRLPGAKVMDVRGKPDGWDIADAVAEGIDPVAFIAAGLAAAVKTEPEQGGDAGEFACLGHDGTHHWFLRRGVRVPYKIALGAFNSSKILTLAPLAYWTVQGHVNDQGGIKAATAQDFIEGLSFDVGQYRPERIRGAGVWRDKDGFLINDGRQIILHNGDTRELDDYKTENHYISSSVQFGTMAGPESTDEDGRSLELLFNIQGFGRPVQAVMAMGWSLVAPFGGVLRWRPHIWVTGRKGSGKSWVLEDLIRPLCGPFAHKGSGKDSEAGIRRSLNMDARPVILDEMEPKGQRATEKVQSILDLARNASSDGSGHITIASPDGGTQRFVVRSCFCFGSIQTPDEGAAIASRISRLELKAPFDPAGKFRASAQLYADCMGDPGRFTRRIFRALPRILADIEWLRTEFLSLFGDQRRADQLAPLLAAAWAARSSEPLSKAGAEWLAGFAADLSADTDASRDDEEEVVDHILGAHIRVESGIKSVAELLRIGYMDAHQGWAQDELARYGIRVYAKGLAIADRAEQLRAILKNTPYATGYGAQIKRHRLAVSDKPAQVRMAGNRVQCWVLDWERFRADYLEDIAPTPAPEQEEIPF